MRWDYIAVTVVAAGNWREAVRPEVDRWCGAGWNLQDVQPVGLDAEAPLDEDGGAGEAFVCIFRRLTPAPVELTRELVAIG
jgi:hypothetical protein